MKYITKLSNGPPFVFFQIKWKMDFSAKYIPNIDHFSEKEHLELYQFPTWNFDEHLTGLFWIQWTKQKTDVHPYFFKKFK